ncbi:acetyltransferase [Anaeroselena agilis]|uniref:Acetyltransferase n=1 Tax=Anaeroselena agilis TaxID=3063788 RepID=A0ABU3P471_9FIRM|nr:acetyltransferase [Selenomonadales bacterium 4137-cl]
MKLPVIVIGAGGHARILIDALVLTGREVIGIVDADVGRHGDKVLGIPVIGDDAAVFAHSPANVELVNGLGSIQSTESREKVYNKFKQAGYSFSVVIHPAATVAPDVRVGEGVQVMAGVVIQTGSRIGSNAIINTRASVDHDCAIGNHTHVAPGAVLSGGVQVGDDVHIGTGAIIIQGIKIGKGSLIAAGAVIVQDVLAGEKIMGVPGKAVKR